MQRISQVLSRAIACIRHGLHETSEFGLDSGYISEEQMVRYGHYKHTRHLTSGDCEAPSERTGPYVCGRAARYMVKLLAMRNSNYVNEELYHLHPTVHMLFE